MKNILNRKILLLIPLLALFGSTFIVSCDDKELSGGEPVITRIYQLDTIARHRDSTFAAAEPYVLLVISGQNIGGVQRAFFNDYETSFNPNYNTNTELIIRVPAEAPTDATASNMIRLVTPRGEATYGFKIVAKPAIFSYDKIFFGQGRGNITFKGKNFADVVRVTAFREKDSPTEIVKDSIVCEIVSQTADRLVVHIPNNTLSRVTLNFTNSSGTTRATDMFVNADLGSKFFTEDFGTIASPDGDGKWGGDSWGNAVKISTASAYSGASSLEVNLSAGGWSWFGMTSWWPRYYYVSDYKYVVFAIKGGADDFPLWITSSASKAGFAEFNDKNKIEVKANTWNFYKMPIAELDFLYEGSIIQQLGFRPKGPDKSELIYVDDFMLIK
jgi:hypothetical protein